MSKSSKDINMTSREDTISIASSDLPKEPRPSELEKAIKNGSYFPKSTPSRPLYLTARSVSAALGIVLIILAVLAKRVVNRPEWLSPILSPAINAWSASTIDILIVQWKDRRYPRLQRLLHDGGIGIGCSIAGGFLIAFTLGDIRGTREGAGAGTTAVAWLILLCMFALVVLHYAISVMAAVEMYRFRRSRRSDAV
ncbi:hypothetical protein CONLIGDRAFT_91155 [Coniochaeta ligniaria NRRL 30616]|uniref:MARVEL domain-containing protein n=1 Tax=Coniochaeta ligniaria NRRL 30616 TaxID=1408157 RepID=A0A1J7ICB6_9PEZI|nr:hypothetical protein CONLIGDRAFT_91155 [Coniochaeta ligniaria NRRL 30616]